jgi:hypothetical protein
MAKSAWLLILLRFKILEKIVAILKASFPSITFSNEQEIKQNHEQKPQ